MKNLERMKKQELIDYAFECRHNMKEAYKQLRQAEINKKSAKTRSHKELEKIHFRESNI